LVEVDLPIREISKHARREKSIRHGHISTLHIWWARRPLAACRAVVLAALLPDPADPDCSESFRRAAADALRRFRDRAGGPPVKEDGEGLRRTLLEFIARFSAWEA
jgi:adenine-specific DNA methylase